MSVIYRPFRPEDSAGVIATLAENYLDDYFYEACYDENHLISANRDGSHLLYVAETTEGEFVGVVGGKYRAYFPESYELSLHALRKRFQGMGYAKELLKYCMERMLAMKNDGVYGHCVSYHTVTQNEVRALGMTTTGIWPGRHLSDRAFFDEKPRSPKLHSVVVAKKGRREDVGALYVPEALRETVGGIYEELDVACRFGTDGEPAWPASTVHVRDTEESHNRDVFIPGIGRDLRERLPKLTRCPEGDAIWSCTVFLNMLEPGCADAVELCRTMGLRFTGIHPLHGGREFIMLHRPPNTGYVSDELRLTDENRLLARKLEL